MTRPITLAIQTYLRLLSLNMTDYSQDLVSLQLLCRSMGELVDQEHIPPGLLKKADSRISEVERMENKNNLPEFGYEPPSRLDAVPQRLLNDMTKSSQAPLVP